MWFELVLYWGTKKVNNNMKRWASGLWYEVAYAQDGYAPFDRDAFDQIDQENWIRKRVLLVARWTPLQELWTLEHQSKIQQYGLLVFTVWWLFDFLSWEETRAPKRVVRSRVLETPRRILTNPRKNLKKFLWMFGIVRYRSYRFFGKTSN